jgi:hypothetical protein
MLERLAIDRDDFLRRDDAPASILAIWAFVKNGRLHLAAR